jgi:hypothetical protein
MGASQFLKNTEGRKQLRDSCWRIDGGSILPHPKTAKIIAVLEKR